MRRILVMNTKGGCGKTTIATNLASYYASQGFTTALTDYDVQGSSTHWLSQRGPEYPAIHGVAAFRQSMSVTRAWATRIPPGTERQVLDTPASLDRLELMERVRGVDAILIPVLPSPIDTHAAAHFVRDLLLIAKLRSQRTKLGIVPNRIRESTPGFDGLQRFLNSLKIPIVTQLHDSQFYVQAAQSGIGVHEIAEPRAKRHQRAWRRLYEWVEEEPATISR